MASKVWYWIIFIQILHFNSIFSHQIAKSPFLHRPDFTTKARISRFWPLTSIEVWGQWGYFASELKVIDQGNFTMEDIYLNRTNTWELLILHKYLIKIFLNICVRIPQQWKMWYVPTFHGWLAYFMYFQGKIKFKSLLCFYPVKRTIIWSKVEKTRLGRRTM